MRSISLNLVALVFVGLPVFAGPSVMDYQGYFEVDGVPLSGNHTLDFALYTQMTGGDSLWGETQSEVPFDRGLFNAELGSVNPLTLALFQYPEVYLSVRIDGSGFGSRTRLASVPYSFLADLASEATHASNADHAVHAIYADSAGVWGGGSESYWAAEGADIHNTNMGNVGVGNSEPRTRLDVHGTLRSTNQTNPTSGVGVELAWDGSNGVVRSYNRDVVGYRPLYLSGSLVHLYNGNLEEPALTMMPDGRIATARDLNLGGRVHFDVSEPSPDAGIVKFGDGTGWKLHFGLWSGVKLLTLVDTGNLGIGKASPEYRVDVSGTTQSTTFLTEPQVLGNGSCRANLAANNLTFEGNYGYAVGDEYLQFNSAYHPQWGDGREMARITGYRNPDDYDAGRGRLKLSVRHGSGLLDVVGIDESGMGVTGNLSCSGNIYGNFQGTINNALLWDGHSWGETYPSATNSDQVDGIHGTQFVRNDQAGSIAGNLAVQGSLGINTASPAYTLDVSGRGRVSGASSSWLMNVSNAETAGSPVAVYATTAGAGTEAAIKGAAWTGSGNTTGLLGVVDSPGIQYAGGNPAGVYGWATHNGPGDAFGVLGRCKTHLSAPGGGWDAPAGVFGWSTSSSGLCWGVWGENASSTDGTAGVRGLAVPTTGTIYGVEGETNSPSGMGVHAIGGMSSAGIIGTEVETSEGRSLMYAVASTQNWFEDFGSGTLENGVARVQLDQRFLEIVDVQLPDDLKIFLTSTSEDIAGRLVVLKDKTGFVVSEQGGTRSRGTFDYRVVALRKGYRGIRLAGVDEPRPDLESARRGLFFEGHKSDPEADRRILEER